MKLLKDYTDEELIEIQDDVDAYNQLFLIECADRGVTLPQMVPTFIGLPEDRDDLKPDANLYELKEGYSGGFYFKELADAEEVMSLISKKGVKANSNYSIGGRTFTLDKDSPDYKIESVPCYSHEKYEEIRAEIKQYEANKNKIKANNDRRADDLRKHEEITNDIYDAIENARKNITRVNELAEVYKTCLKMADNDTKVALKFMFNANKEELLEYDEKSLKAIGLSKVDIDIAVEEDAQVNEALS